jgi:predicted aspartyl protease
MGRVTQHITIINAADLLAVGMKLKPSSEIRSIELEMIVDIGAMMVCLPPELVQQLGLLFDRWTSVRTANGIVERKIFSPVRIEAFERHAIIEVLENDEGTPPLLGYLALEVMDLQVSAKEQALMPNPINGGRWLVDCVSPIMLDDVH